MAKSGIAVTAIVLSVISMLLLVILLPLSFGYVHYYQLGLLKGRTTGKVSITRVYTSGRYAVGPSNTMQLYDADAHVVTKSGVSLASADKLETTVDFTFAYFIIPSKLGLLQRDFNRNYQNVVEARVVSAIKNAATGFRTEQYFEDRQIVQDGFLAAARAAVENSSYVTLPVFLLTRVQVPDTVAKKQLQTAIQTQINLQQLYDNQAAEVRKDTTTLANKLNNDANVLVQTSIAQAANIVSQASSNATRIVEVARAGALDFMAFTLNVTQPINMQQLDYVMSLLESNANGAGATLHVGYATKLITA